MMYSHFLLIISVIIAGSALWMTLVKGETEVFSKRLYKYVLTIFMMGAVLGAAAFLKRPPFRLSAQAIFIVSHLLMFIFGVWHTAALYKRHSWVWDEKQSFRLALPFTLLSVAFAALGYFVFFWMTEVPVFKSREGLADNHTLGFLSALLPVTVLWAHQTWNKIPIVTRELQPWIPNLDKKPVIIEPGPKSIPLSIHIPTRHQSNDIITFDVRAPLDNTFEEIFFHLLYKNNILDRSIRKIEVAENNQKSQIYGWVFFTAHRKWWGIRRQYIDPHDKVQFLSLEQNRKIFAERMKVW